MRLRYSHGFVFIFLLAAAPLSGALTIGLHPGLNIFKETVGYGGLVSLDWGFGAGGNGPFVQAVGGWFTTAKDGFTVRNLFAGGGGGWRLPLGAGFSFVPGLAAGLGFDRRQEDGNPATDHRGLTAFASLALEYRAGADLGFSLAAFPLLVDNDGFRLLSAGTTLGISWRFGGGSALAAEVRRSGLFQEGVESDGSRMRIDLPDVSFDMGSARLAGGTHGALDGLARRLLQHRVRRISIEGHSDDSGSAAANDELSARRAEAVAAVLIAGGIEAQLINTQGYGSRRPRHPNDSEENRRRNRRVEITVTE